MTKIGLAIALAALWAAAVTVFAEGTLTRLPGDRGHLVVIPIASFQSQDVGGIAVDRSLELIRLTAEDVAASFGANDRGGGDSSDLELDQLDYSSACRNYCEGKEADCLGRCTQCAGSVRTVARGQISPPAAATEADQIVCLSLRVFVTLPFANAVDEIKAQVRLEMNYQPYHVASISLLSVTQTRALGETAQLNRPAGLAFNPNNNTLIIADTGNCAVKVAYVGPASAPVVSATNGYPVETLVGGECRNSLLRRPLSVASVGGETFVLDEGSLGDSVIKNIQEGSANIVATNLPPAASIHGVFYPRWSYGEQWALYTAGRGGIHEVLIDPVRLPAPQRSHFYLPDGSDSHPTGISSDGNGLIYFIHRGRIVRTLPPASMTPLHARCPFETAYETVVGTNAQPGSTLVEAPANFDPVDFAIVDGGVVNPNPNPCSSLTRSFDTTGVVLNWNSQTRSYEIFTIHDPGAMEGNI
ncbi:MAG: hypothetical protein HYR55_16935 [Acidobacteria bacterium]|nr:hypothetical protein [Acidobacteriota bacterium]MBI3655530.1 hypothetical protein [Acidobacteriota bacterium]